jgi:DNA-binding transcriptional LysR family regulator
MDLRPPLDLKTLYYFTILAEEKHFGLAAKRIGIEQPPLSLQIKKLEEKAGGKLFDRSNKRVRLTAAGEALLPEARQLLSSSHRVLDRIKKINSGEAGTLQIGFTSSTIFAGIPNFIQQHKKAYPEIGYALRERSPADQIGELLAGTLDIGFIRQPDKVAGIATCDLPKESWVAALSGAHPLARKKMLNVSDLKNELFVLFPIRIAPTQFEGINAIFKAAGFYPTIVQEANEWQTIVNLVESNLGVSICPSSFQKIKIGDIRYIPLADVKEQTGITACFHAGNESALLHNFLQTVLSSDDLY